MSAATVLLLEEWRDRTLSLPMHRLRRGLEAWREKDFVWNWFPPSQRVCGEHTWDSTPMNNLNFNGASYKEISMSKKASTSRYQIDITPEMTAEMSKLIEVTGLPTKKELINNALTLFRWAVQQCAQGYQIASITEDGQVHRELQMPSLEHAQLCGASGTRHSKSSWTPILVDDLSKEEITARKNKGLEEQEEDMEALSKPSILVATG